jgi:vancomycin resistance protein YoaR
MTIPEKIQVKKLIKSLLWFSCGAIVGFFFFFSFLYVLYKQTHTNLIYEGVLIDGINFGGKTQEQVAFYFTQKNNHIQQTNLTLTHPEVTATISAKQIEIGYDSDLLAKQAMSIGRSSNMLANASLMLQAYMQGVNLPSSYHYQEKKLDLLLQSLQKKLDKQPIEALFTFENGRISAFQLPQNGQQIETKALKKQIISTMVAQEQITEPQTITLEIPLKKLLPRVSEEKTTDLGITELVATGTSLFAHSIENRLYNINLAASRLNGVLIAPGETFSMVKTIGDVSTTTGYKQAYVIENGKTVLGDGGGVCQVSTTLFRAALNAGLPIIERHPHAYRVGYYEQDSDPGIDAAIYYPSVDLQFKNDTNKHLLIQTVFNPYEQRLTFNLYGTKDTRQVSISNPVITSESPAPAAVYQDDPTLPKGEIKQVDFSADGANVFFTRTVTKEGKIIISDKFVSNYRPWQAIFLRGTKE